MQGIPDAGDARALRARLADAERALAEMCEKVAEASDVVLKRHCVELTSGTVLETADAANRVAVEAGEQGVRLDATAETLKALEEVAKAARDYAPISSEHRGEGQENCMNLSCTLLRALAALDAVRAKATP